MHKKVTATVAADAASTLPNRGQCPHRSVIRIHPQAHVFVIAADQEHGIVGSGTGHDGHHSDDRLVGNAQAQLRQPRHRGPRRHRDTPIVINGSAMVDGLGYTIGKIASTKIRGRDLDRMHISITGVGEVADGGRRSGNVAVRVDPAAVCFTMSATRLYAS